jgi:hypothetical protein
MVTDAERFESSLFSGCEGLNKKCKHLLEAVSRRSRFFAIELCSVALCLV